MLDLLVKGGSVIDGTGNPWFKASIGVKNGKITEVGILKKSDSRKTIDAEGLIVTPGFIDIHTHSDLTLLINPRAESMIRQGVTTEVIGNCGLSPAPNNRKTLHLLKEQWGLEANLVKWNWRTFADYLGELERKISVNVAPLVGHGTIRTSVIGVKDRHPTTSEMAQMKALVADSMEAGAFGMSSGLVYLPGCYARTSELIDLCRVVAQYGGFYTSHTRGERETIIDSLKEAIKIGESTGIPVEVSHNCPKYGGHGKLKKMFTIYEKARARDVEVTMDNDAHTDFNPYLIQVLPQWVQAGGKEKITERLRDPKKRQRVKREILEEKHPGPGYVGLVRHGRWERIFVFSCKKNQDLIGKSIAEIANQRKIDPFDAYLDLIIEQDGEISALFNYIEQDDIRILLRHPLMMVCTDGAASATYGELRNIEGYSPCSYGEYPYILERFVREEHVLSLQEAIRKMTSFPAQKLGLRDRGLLRENMWADIVIFNQSRVKDKATDRFPYRFPLRNYPHGYPDGFEYVIVNGKVVVEKGRHKAIFPGKVLRHKAHTNADQVQMSK